MEWGSGLGVIACLASCAGFDAVGIEIEPKLVEMSKDIAHDHKIDAEFEVTPEMLDQFRVFLSDRQIRPGLGEWLAEREFVSNRLKTEVFNQAVGVEKGDEVEAERDPVILKALEVISAPAR